MIRLPTRRGLRAAMASTAMALALAACAQTPKPTPKPEPTKPIAVKPPPPKGPTATPGLSARDRQAKAIELLGLGQREQARAEIVQLLADQPANAVARRLLDQIDKDPRVLLGTRNYPYKVKPGETLSQLADRFLGDASLFYALARYNNIQAPAQTEAGRTLLIPGTPKKAAPPKAVVNKPADAAAAPVASAPVAPVRNPARASQIRGQALVDMNSGAIDRAVMRLRQAQQLDPDSGPIKGDLERALRIQAAVRGR